MSRNLPVGASKGALDDALQSKVEANAPKRSFTRRVVALLPGVLTIASGLMVLGGLLIFFDGETVGGLWVMGIFSLLTFVLGWVTWRWGRGLPPARFMATEKEQRELWDDD